MKKNYCLAFVCVLFFGMFLDCTAVYGALLKNRSRQQSKPVQAAVPRDQRINGNRLAPPPIDPGYNQPTQTVRPPVTPSPVVPPPVTPGKNPTSGYQTQIAGNGVRISKIYPNTTASTLTHSAGKQIRLEPGDHLISINGFQIRSDADFKRIVAGLPRNSSVSVEVIDRRTSLREIFYGRMDVSSSLRFGLSLTE